tara:strand:+ start:286 stop:483 length:198 start_codon:yes stop_codon:yes gene_type:complete
MILKWIGALVLILVFLVAGTLTILLVENIRYIFIFVFSLILVFAAMFLIKDIANWVFSFFNGRID